MENQGPIKTSRWENHLRFSLGVIVGVVFGVILGAIASYSYVTTFASSLTSITHISKDINKLVSFSYDSNRWLKDDEKLTLKSDLNCQVYAGAEEIDLTGLRKTEDKLKVYNKYEAVDTIYFNVRDNVPQKRLVSFNIVTSLGKKENEKLKYIFHLNLDSNKTIKETTLSKFEDCSTEFEKILQTFTLRDVKK